jgi:hypothetical protein
LQKRRLQRSLGGWKCRYLWDWRECPYHRGWKPALIFILADGSRLYLRIRSWSPFCSWPAFQTPVSKTRFSEKYTTLLAKGCNTFFDCAVFFTVSIQISCVVVLVRRDFGINANGVGGLTTQITWAIALLCMLPLIYPLTVLSHISKEKGGYKFFLFCGCWVLFSYTFISQMIGEFTPSQVGEGAGDGGTTIITTDEWNKLTDLCFSGVQVMSSTEQAVLRGFGATGSLVSGLAHQTNSERTHTKYSQRAIELSIWLYSGSSY